MAEYYSDSSEVDSIHICDSNSSGEESYDDGYGGPIRATILGYQFEPMAEKNTRESSDDVTNNSDGEEIDDIWRQRMETTDWCDCQCCEIMETPEENACCNEKGPILARIEKCITCHPGFRSNCLDIWVLETVYYQ
ncbi:uncharacterized protein LOC141903288 [Tubulanus polymorphus]|uniref:uncharacterized protein LOC141903288 n=1 Tax=Tubulanus polymorphus TaxID=672921 RepID=UPI003DA3E4E0